MSSFSAPRPEIETFKRRKLAFIPFSFSVINIFFIWLIRNLNGSSSNFNLGLFYTCLSMLSLIHLFYTVILIMAPRFLFRGKVWIKVGPWIVSSAGLFTFFFFMNPPGLFSFIYSFLGFLLQLVQYIICVSQKETKFSFIFKPFEKRIVPNLLAKIDLTDPNTRLDNIFGPAIVIPKSFDGQSPAVVRYGSQAVNVHLQQQQQQHQQQYFHQPTDYNEASVPAYAPPVYEMTVDSVKHKSQYDIKK